MQENSSIWHVTIYHHDRDIKHHGRDKEITIASLSIVSQDCEMCQLWAAHDLMSRSWLSLLSSWLQLIILCKMSGVLTIWCHDCEKAPWARDQSCIHQRLSLGCSRSYVMIVSMLHELVIIKCLQDFISSRGLGRSRSDVTIVSKPSQLVTFSTSISKEVWDAHDPISRSWACTLSSWA